MDKKVLLLEDNAYMNSSLKELLEEDGYIVFEARKITDANDIFKNGVNFLIIDLNVSTIGLTDEELRKTEGGILSGWVWIQDYVLASNPEYKRKIIIYSAYTHLLKEKYFEEIKGIKIIQKGKENVPSYVVKELNKL